MLLRRCQSCGAAFEGTGEQRFCPECRAAAKRATVVLPRTCATCGAVFDGGPRAKYCPECRAKRKKEQDRLYKRNGAARPLGSTDICEICGKPYTVTSGLQRYCPTCAPEAVRQNVLPSKRARALAHLEENISRKREFASNSGFCVVCGKGFRLTPSRSPTCSRECEKKCAANPSLYLNFTQELPQSPVSGVHYVRLSKNWELDYHGKRIGSFATRQEAEAKKFELDAQNSTTSDDNS